MKALFKKLLGSTSMTTSTELREAIAAAEADERRSEDANAAAQSHYQSSLLDPDPEASVAALRKVNEAKVAGDRARALTAALRERLVEAEKREADAAKADRYAEGLRRQKAAVAAARKFVPQAKAIVSTIATIAEADEIIREVNANLPDGAEPIASVEQELRGLPAIPGRLIQETSAALWVYAGWPEMRVEADKVPLIETKDGITGTFIDPWGPNSDEIKVIKRRLVTRKVQASQAALAPPPLHASVVLPGFTYGATPIFTPTPDPRFSPVTPRDVIEHIRALEQAAGNSPADPRGTASTPDTLVEWENINPDDQAELDAAIAAAGGAM